MKVGFPYVIDITDGIEGVAAGGLRRRFDPEFREAGSSVGSAQRTVRKIAGWSPVTVSSPPMTRDWASSEIRLPADSTVTSRAGAERVISKGTRVSVGSSLVVWVTGGVMVALSRRVR